MMKAKFSFFTEPVHEYELPLRYTLRKGVKWDNKIRRYLWCPKPGNLVWFPLDKVVLRYVRWVLPRNTSLEGIAVNVMDGGAVVKIYHRFKESKFKPMSLFNGEIKISNNLTIRAGVPVVRVHREYRNTCGGCGFSFRACMCYDETVHELG